MFSIQIKRIDYNRPDIKVVDTKKNLGIAINVAYLFDNRVKRDENDKNKMKKPANPEILEQRS